MKKVWRSMITVIMAAVLLFTVTGCSFSIGNVPKTENEDQEDLFPDAEGDRKNSSYEAYNFSLKDLGTMTVYVDTTEGHNFELVTDNSGFNIVDEDGNAVLYVACLNEDAYQNLTAGIDRVETINGREFLYKENGGDGSIDAFSYMADCGLDCGLVMESHTNEDVFKLVAFRGTAIEGASSDPYAYRGETEIEPSIDDDDMGETDTDIDDADEDDADTEDADTEDNSGSFEVGSADSSLSADAERALASLDTDYQKVNWVITYAPFEEYPNFIVSVTPYVDYGDYCLLLAFTNLYEEPLSFSGDVMVYTEDGSEAGSSYVYTGTLCKGNTLIETVNCGDTLPDGGLEWSDCSLSEPYKEYAAWEADVNIDGDPGDGYLTAEYSITSVENEDMTPGDIAVILLDGEGTVIAVGSYYDDEVVAAGDAGRGSFSIYQEESLLTQVADFAMFAAPEKE